MAVLAGKGKGKKPRGEERRKMWDDVKALRKEFVFPFMPHSALELMVFEGTASGKAASSSPYFLKLRSS